WDANRRQLDVLTVFKKSIDAMASGFSAASSGLERLATFGARVQASEAYASLADLVRYDARLATLNLKVGVGADGRIRGFEVLSGYENAENPCVNPVWRRWLAKCELFLRGYRFSDGEVMARLIDAVFSGIEQELVALVQLLGDMEFYLGALGFRDRAQRAGLGVCLPELVVPSAPRRLEGLFNPLLLMSGVKPVPCTLTTNKLKGTVLVTGPNSGGKTRLPPAGARTQLPAQAGCLIPARSGSVALVPALAASLIAETRAGQAAGRLGRPLMRV